MPDSPRSGTRRRLSSRRRSATSWRSGTAGSPTWPACRSSSTANSASAPSCTSGAETKIETEVVWTDYTPKAGARETRRLLTATEPPTAILFDSDLLAVTGLGVAQQMGLTVPGDLSIVGWDDSLISQVVHPPLTAISRDIVGYGMTTARHLAQVVGRHGHRRRRGRPR